MAFLELSDQQFSCFASRVLPHMDVIQGSRLTEQEKLLAIGHIVSGTLDDFRSVYRENHFVTPSVLPAHDDVTIDRLAQRQRALHAVRSMTDVQRSLVLERLEHAELIIQASERVPLPTPEPEEDPPDILPWFAQGGE